MGGLQVGIGLSCPFLGIYSCGLLVSPTSFQVDLFRLVSFVHSQQISICNVIEGLHLFLHSVYKVNMLSPNVICKGFVFLDLLAMATHKEPSFSNMCN